MDIKPLCLHPGVYIMIGVGAIMMVVGFLGCYGAIQESQCLLGTVSHSHTSPCPGDFCALYIAEFEFVKIN